MPALEDTLHGRFAGLSRCGSLICEGGLCNTRGTDTVGRGKSRAGGLSASGA